MSCKSIDELRKEADIALDEQIEATQAAVKRVEEYREAERVMLAAKRRCETARLNVTTTRTRLDEAIERLCSGDTRQC